MYVYQSRCLSVVNQLFFHFYSYISNAPKLSYLSKNVFEGISDTIEIM